MFARILKLIKEKVHKRAYVMTIHAEEEMEKNDM